MPVPAQEQIKQWRARWGSKDNPNDVQRVRDIVKIIQKTINNERRATAELIEYLKENLELNVITEELFLQNEIEAPDLRGFPIDLVPVMERDLSGVRMKHWRLEGASLGESDLSRSHLSYCHLESANLGHTNLDSAKMEGVYLENSFLLFARLEFADLRYAKMENANLRYTYLCGANLSHSSIAEASFSGAFYRPKLRYFSFGYHLDKIAILLYRKLMIYRYDPEFILVDKQQLTLEKLMRYLLFGYIYKTSFIGVSLAKVDLSANRMLERYIKDQQFLYEFRRNHPITGFIWNLTSKCGQSVPRLAFWVALVISVFAAIYYNFDVVKLLEPDKIARSWSALYTSVNIFSNLGMGDKDPLNKIGAILIMIETMLGFVALGLLLTVAGSRFARRS